MIKIFGTSSCPACNWVKQTFDRIGEPYEYKELGVDVPHSDFRAAYPEVNYLPYMIGPDGHQLTWQEFKQTYESR